MKNITTENAALLGSTKSEAKTAAARANGARGGRPKKAPYATTFHRDGSVTVWDVYRQGWLRTSNPSDDVLASLGWEEREKVIAHTA